MKDRKDVLIRLLFDQSASITERDDAAMDLSNFDDNRALTALLQVGSDFNEEKMILNSCGESIGEILVKRESLDLILLDKLTPVAKMAAYSFIKEIKPEWVSNRLEE